MDKILAFSILSSSPADIAAGGVSTRLSWRSGAGKQQQVEKAPAPKKQQEGTAEQGKGSPGPGRKQEAMPRFAPEFDGINCFESIVSF